MHTPETLQLQRSLLQLRQEMYQRPIRVPTRGGSTASIKAVRIIGGNPLGSSLVEAIQYAPSVVPTTLYDPNVDTSYPVGLGYGALYINGIIQDDLVLIRHNFTGEQVPVLTGRVVGVLGTETLTVSGGPDDGETMTAYTIWWA